MDAILHVHFGGIWTQQLVFLMQEIGHNWIFNMHNFECVLYKKVDIPSQFQTLIFMFVLKFE